MNLRRPMTPATTGPESIPIRTASQCLAGLFGDGSDLPPHRDGRTRDCF
jgi:hypothetical protein